MEHNSVSLSNEVLFFQENPLIIAIWIKIMLFGPGSRCDLKSTCRFSFLSIFSHKVELIFFQVEQISDADAYAISVARFT